MKREFTVTLEGTRYPVVAEGETITVDGRAYTVEIDDEGAVLVDGIAYDVSLEGEKATVGDKAWPLQVEGLALAAAPSAPQGAPSRGSAQAGAGAVLAIMPGKIIRVLVEPGQRIEEGQPVCVLEAMKMENELNAPIAGTVRAVHVHPGDDVEKGQLLVEIDE